MTNTITMTNKEINAYCEDCKKQRNFKHMVFVWRATYNLTADEANKIELDRIERGMTVAEMHKEMRSKQKADKLEAERKAAEAAYYKHLNETGEDDTDEAYDAFLG